MVAERALSLFAKEAKGRQGTRSDLVATSPRSEGRKARDDAAKLTAASPRYVQGYRPVKRRTAAGWTTGRLRADAGQSPDPTEKRNRSGDLPIGSRHLGVMATPNDDFAQGVARTCARPRVEIERHRRYPRERVRSPSPLPATSQGCGWRVRVGACASTTFRALRARTAHTRSTGCPRAIKDPEKGASRVILNRRPGGYKMVGRRQQQGGAVTLEAEEVTSLRAALDGYGSTRHLAAAASVSAPTLLRALAALPIRRGSAALLRDYLRGAGDAA